MAANACLWASEATARASLHDPSYIPKGVIGGTGFCWNLDWGSGPEALMDLHPGSSVGWAWSCLWWRCFLIKLRISWQIFSAISASHGSIPGTLFNWYTSLYTLWISSWVVLKPMSLMVGTSALKSHSGEGCQWPQQIAWPHSFCLVALAWASIHCNRNGWWSPPSSHLRYSSRNTSASRCLSTSHRNACFLGQLFGGCCFPRWLS